MTDPIDIVDELRGFAEGSESARATLMRDAADEIERLRGEVEWEYQGIPIYEDGREAVGRPIGECEEWIAEHADPSHWIHEPRNSDLAPVVAYRVERRRPASEWEPIPKEARDA